MNSKLDNALFALESVYGNGEDETNLIDLMTDMLNAGKIEDERLRDLVGIAMDNNEAEAW